jgi:pre-rRNA-processing protein IPI3
MLVESFIAATLVTSTKSNTTSALKDVGIVLHEYQPHISIRHGFKKSSTKVNCVAITNTHIFAAQADKAVVLVYSREKGNQEATVPFPERITSLDFVGESSGFLILGTEGGRLNVWDVASGRQTISTASHLQSVSCLSVLPGHNFILSGSPDSNVHLWSLPQLVSFSQPSSLSSHGSQHNAPLRTFSNHRSGIMSLACGHSRSLSNFAVSASNDGTCYVWRASDCQVLRTILFDSAPQCLIIDPADRALYSGHEDGSIQCFDFYNDSQNFPASHSAVPSDSVEVKSEDSWSPASVETGSTQCLTLSYDGTALLSGHSSGRIVAWDVAKHRVQKVIADLGNPVTNIAMQRPEGLPSKRPHIEVITVVKPRLEHSSSTPNGIPSDYALQIQITSPPQRTNLPTPPSDTSFPNLLSHSTFPKSLIDEAILTFTCPPAPQAPDPQYDITFPSAPSTPVRAPQTAILQSRITFLEENLSIYISAAERSRARRRARMERREEYGRKKREAFFEAENRGEDGDGDAVMRAWEKREREVDVESDEVELAEEVYAPV